MIHFSREALAAQLAEALRGKSVFGDAHNGLFLAAPRRTGKSTFLQADLGPALERMGCVVVYVDLWADTRRDPAALIADAIARSLEPRMGAVSRAAKAAGVESLSIAGALKLDLSRIGKVDGVTLPDALRVLHRAAKAPVVLIVDEAQQALTSADGEATMAALKSARDQLNRPGEINLMLVMSGSDRDRLLRLVNTHGASFYGSPITRMPSLGPDFIDHVARLVVVQRSELAPVDTAVLMQAFETFGHRPQFFMDALGQALSPLAVHGGRFEPAVLDAARQRQHDDEAQLDAEYLALRPLERALLWRMLEQGPRFRPYDSEALRFYQDKAGAGVTPQAAQRALEALRERTPALVWKSARGEYAVEDAAMHRWFEQRTADRRWPPTDPRESASPGDRGVDEARATGRERREAAKKKTPPRKTTPRKPAPRRARQGVR